MALTAQGRGRVGVGVEAQDIRTFDRDCPSIGARARFRAYNVTGQTGNVGTEAGGLEGDPGGLASELWAEARRRTAGGQQCLSGIAVLQADRAPPPAFLPPQDNSLPAHLWGRY